MQKIISWLKAVLFIPPPPAEIFEGLRTKALHLKPEEIRITKAKFPNPVWGVLFEMGTPNRNMTLVCLVDNSVSLYVSSGGGVLGAGKKDSVRIAASSYLASANDFYSLAQKVDSFPTPSSDQATFYFLTYDGIYSHSAMQVELGEDRDKLSKLFHEALVVMNQVLLVSQHLVNQPTTNQKGIP